MGDTALLHFRTLTFFFAIKGQKTSAQACCFLTPISLWCGTVRSVNPQIIYKSLSGLVNYLWTIVFGWLHLVVFFPGRLRNAEIFSNSKIKTATQGFRSEPNFVEKIINVRNAEVFSKLGKKINCRNFSFQNKNYNPGLPFWTEFRWKDYKREECGNIL